MLKHDFNPEVKDFYLSNELLQCNRCPGCGSELHHILKRTHWYHASIFNSSLICRTCHNKHDIHSKEVQKELLNRTVDLLMRYNYTLKEIDIIFIKNYYENYRPEILSWATFSNINT